MFLHIIGSILGDRLRISFCCTQYSSGWIFESIIQHDVALNCVCPVEYIHSQLH